MAVMRRSIVMLFVLFTATAGAEEAAVPAVKTIIPPVGVKTLMASRCQPCHFELRVKPSLLLNTGKWFRLVGNNFEIERRVFLESPPHSMPMGALLDQRERAMLRSWFNKLHKEL